MEETFSPSYDMTKYVGSDRKLLREQGFSGDMDSYWTKWVRGSCLEMPLKGNQIIRRRDRLFSNTQNQCEIISTFLLFFYNFSSIFIQIPSLILYVLSKYFVTSKLSCFSI